MVLSPWLPAMRRAPVGREARSVGRQAAGKTIKSKLNGDVPK
ncbi:MAG: hypothetical protein QME05_03380 [Candidatus Margulisbacteria bacterium]|nr:hypothetical protein [Candidatus Margulisiibacteriota bacterium]